VLLIFKDRLIIENTGKVGDKVMKKGMIILAASFLAGLTGFTSGMPLAQEKSGQGLVSPFTISARQPIPSSEKTNPEGLDRAKSLIRSKASFKIPEGWREYEESILGEPVLTLSRAGFTIGIHLFGGPDSRHETPEKFLKSFEARDDRGGPATPLHLVQMGSRQTTLYCRDFSLSGKDRDKPEALALTKKFREQFVVIPAEGPAFFVLTYTVQVEPPLGKEPSDATWRSFLRSFKLASWPKANEKTGPSEQNFPPEIWEKPRNFEQGEGLPREIKENIQQNLKKRQEAAPASPKE
jgi:hypothetical protein